MSGTQQDIIVTCPHCHDPVIIQQINCGIFRHGIFRHNNKQIPPHSSKQDCDIFVEHNLIFGCGKPFSVKKDTYQVEICDYI